MGRADIPPDARCLPTNRARIKGRCLTFNTELQDDDIDRGERGAGAERAPGGGPLYMGYKALGRYDHNATAYILPLYCYRRNLPWTVQNEEETDLITVFSQII